MNRSGHLLTLLEALRIPLNSPAGPLDWKDWYHFILFDMAHGCRILCNVSLAGRPEYGHITCTGIVTVPPGFSAAPIAAGSYGFCVDHDWLPGMALPVPVTVITPDTCLRIDQNKISMAMKDDRTGIGIVFDGIASATPVLAPEAAPFGSGFIGWGFVPGVLVTGHCAVGGGRIDVDPENWFCYHDHNYGRFRWGEDVGWVWFVATFRNDAGDKVSFVLHRGNSRDPATPNAPYLFVYRNGEMRKVFTGDAVSLEWTWDPGARRPVRLPGSMASLFEDRLVCMPASLCVTASDDADSVRLIMRVSDSLELILPDTSARQYTFISELNGDASVSLDLDGTDIAAEGFFYAEYVY
jgi:hypothetical protein